MKLNQDEVVKILKSKKIKLTPNRIKIACELFNSDDHPSIEDIHQKLLENGERISFTSIYNIVKLFESVGLVKEIKVGNKSHYDPNIFPHVHFICKECGNVSDMNVPETDNENLYVVIHNIMSDYINHEVDDFELNFYGTCEECKKNKHGLN
ncbi:MAG TPA: transcriptional repressor [Defluviitoga sp.]|nr:transcriptional repressor [Defluviitoga sp.]HPZ29289.1 transcriptional repressor [Defluviitoga sp.]HQD63199.1 transcriptional repressor [Defluviitoga sp.]